MKHLKVRDVMTCNPCIVRPTQSVQEAAQAMQKNNCGVLPVGQGGHVVGMLTDRDITLRVVAPARNPAETRVQEAMTEAVHSCCGEDTLEEAAEIMRSHNVSRLLVMKEGEVTGIVSFKDLLGEAGNKERKEVVQAMMHGQRHRKHA